MAVDCKKLSEEMESDEANQRLKANQQVYEARKCKLANLFKKVLRR